MATERNTVAPVTNISSGGAASSTSPVDTLQRLLSDDLAAVNQLIVDNMHSPVEMIPRLAGYLIAAGGKRLRPLLTLASARMVGYEGDRHLPLAACVEFIHTATLLHDDVVDESMQRRGLASANAMFGNQASVLVGDFLFSRAFQLMVRDGSLRVLEILSNASAVIAEGEVMQLSTANNTATTEDEYLSVIRGKTAELFQAACRIGPVVGGRPVEDEEALAAYGLNFGIAFQLVDDVLDYSRPDPRLGKEIGDDFREGKMTLPVVVAFAAGDETERAFWRRTLEDMDQRDGDLEHALDLVERHGALETTKERARDYAAAARNSLSHLPDHPVKDALDALVVYSVDRRF